MVTGSARSARRARAIWRVAITCALAAGAIAAAGCGGSSKPAYCSTRTDLENSVKGLTSLNVSSGVSGLESQLKKIESNATKLVSQAKSDFSSETQAIKSSLDSLTAAVKGLSSSPSTGQIATVASDASKFVDSVKSFTDATSSKCK
jgi:uncharacterized protein YoxC